MNLLITITKSSLSLSWEHLKWCLRVWNPSKVQPRVWEPITVLLLVGPKLWGPIRENCLGWCFFVSSYQGQRARAQRVVCGAGPGPPLSWGNHRWRRCCRTSFPNWADQTAHYSWLWGRIHPHVRGAPCGFPKERGVTEARDGGEQTEWYLGGTLYETWAEGVLGVSPLRRRICLWWPSFGPGSAVGLNLPWV